MTHEQNTIQAIKIGRQDRRQQGRCGVERSQSKKIERQARCKAREKGHRKASRLDAGTAAEAGHRRAQAGQAEP